MTHGDVGIVIVTYNSAREIGPCLDAALGSVMLSIPDTATEDRWKGFAQAALKAGVLSTLSTGIPIQDAVVGALNMYATTRDDFDAEAMALAQTFAGYAAIALANAHLYASSAALASAAASSLTPWRASAASSRARASPPSVDGRTRAGTCRAGARSSRARRGR